MGRPALPAAAPTVRFTRIPKLHNQYPGISREFEKKILEHGWTSSRICKQKEEHKIRSLSQRERLGERWPDSVPW